MRNSYLRYCAEGGAHRRYCPGQFLGATTQCSSWIRWYVAQADIVPSSVSGFLGLRGFFLRTGRRSSFFVKSILQTLTQITRTSHHLRRVSHGQHLPVEGKRYAARVRSHSRHDFVRRLAVQSVIPRSFSRRIEQQHNTMTAVGTNRSRAISSTVWYPEWQLEGKYPIAYIAFLWDFTRRGTTWLVHVARDCRNFH